MESFPSDHPEPHSRTSSGKPAWLMVQDGQPWGAQLPCQSSSRGAGKGGSGVKAEPWASCDPQSPPVGKAGNTSLCLLNHAVHWRLGGNPVGLGILALGVKHYRGVVKIAAGRALQRQRPEAQKRPWKWESQVREETSEGPPEGVPLAGGGGGATGPHRPGHFLLQRQISKIPSTHLLCPHLVKMRHARPGTLCCRACTWTNISSSNKIQRNSKGLNLTACMHSWGKFWTRDTKRPKTHLPTLEEPGAKALCRACPLHRTTPKRRQNT